MAYVWNIKELLFFTWIHVIQCVIHAIQKSILQTVVHIVVPHFQIVLMLEACFIHDHMTIIVCRAIILIKYTKYFILNTTPIGYVGARLILCMIASILIT